MLQLGMKFPSGAKADKLKNHNVSNMEFVGLKVECDVVEDNEDDDTASVSVDHRSKLFTQAIKQTYVPIYATVHGQQHGIFYGRVAHRGN